MLPYKTIIAHFEQFVNTIMLKIRFNRGKI